MNIQKHIENCLEYFFPSCAKKVKCKTCGKQILRIYAIQDNDHRFYCSELCQEFI